MPGRQGDAHAAAARRCRPSRRCCAPSSAPRSTAAAPLRHAGHGEVPHGAARRRCSPTCAPARSARTRASPTIALHARTAEQHYAGDARWDAIGELKAHVRTIPVLGNGDIWVADDALAMMPHTGCDGVVDRARLPRPAVAVRRPARRVRRSAAPPPSRPARRRRRRDGRARRRPRRPPRQRAHRDARLPQAHRLVLHRLPGRARRCAAASPRCRRSPSSTTCSRRLDRTITVVEGGERIRRGHTNGPIKVSLPGRLPRRPRRARARPHGARRRRRDGPLRRLSAGSTGPADAVERRSLRRTVLDRRGRRSSVRRPPGGPARMRRRTAAGDQCRPAIVRRRRRSAPARRGPTRLKQKPSVQRRRRCRRRRATPSTADTRMLISKR